MQSMKTPYLSSFGARRSEGGFGQRSAWTMWVVAALLAVLATALPLHRPVSADDPVFTVNVTNIEYETATASLTITGFPSTIKSDNWIVRVNYSSPSDSYGTSLDAGPGLDRPGHDDDLDGEVDEPDEGGDDFVAVRNGTQITADNISMVKLVPDSEHTIEVTLYEVHSGGSWLNRGKGSETFDSKGGCYVHTDINGDPDPDNDPAHDPKGPNNLRPKWFGGSFDFSKRTETELTLDVFVTNSGLAGVNSGRCIYYSYRARGGADRGPFSAYVYTKSGGRRAWIKLTELEMGTTYDFNVSFHPTLQDGNVGTQGRTLGSRMAVESVNVDNITQTSARATIAVDNPGSQTHTVYYRYFKTADEDDPSLHETGSADTVKGPIVFNLSGLTATTEYKVEASLKSGFPTNQSEFDVFPTKPNKPTGLIVTPGDRQLEVSWTKPAGGDAIDEYIVQWKSGSETFGDAETDGREVTIAHVSGTTTYGTTISSLANGTEYTLQVIAKNESGEAVSDPKTGTPDILPGKPTIQSVSEGNTLLVVTWDEPANTGSDITGYVLQWKSGNQAYGGDPAREATKQETELSHEITGLDNGTEYTVRVRAVNGLVLPDEHEDDYNWSDDDTGTPRPEPTVTGVTVAETSITRTTATATVAIDNQTGESQTVHLRHRVNTSGSSWTDATPKNTAGLSETFDLSSLTGNTEYLVEAWLATTPNSKESATFTTDPVEADAPRNVRITGHGDKELTVAWDAPSDMGGSLITGYKVQWKLSSQIGWSAYSEKEDDDNQSPYTITENLTNGDEYAVRIVAVTSAGDGSPSIEAKDTPRTIPDAPTISSVTVGDRKLTVTWTAPTEDGGADITGYKVQWKDNSVTTDWDSPTGVTEVSESGLTREITGLTNGTTYDVRVRADNGETSTAYNWDEDSGTPRPDPSVDSIDVDPIEQTTAIATVNITDPTDEQKMVHLRFRVNSSSEAWTTPPPQSTTIDSVAFPQFTGLKSDTEYMVEASFDGNFVNAVISKTFKTKRPTVSSVEIDENTIGQAGATAIVRIQEPNGETQTVHLRYRPATQNDWSETAPDAGSKIYPTTLDAVSIQIADLKSDTLYEVEASLESDYSQSKTTTFTTEGPSLTGITISEVMQESAKAIIDIEAPNGRSLPVYVRYRKVTDPVNGLWAYVDTSSTGAIADAPLSNLTSGTEYEAEASLDRSFPDTEGVTVTSDPFTTEGPSLTGLTVMRVTLTGATLKVDIQAHNDESQTINYRYRPGTQTDWSTTAADAGSDSASSATESAEFTLGSLSSGTQYEVQATLDSDLDNPTLPVLEAKFTTLTPDPSISDVDIDAKQTTAKATITIANPGTSGNTVHLHFRVQGTNTWSSPALTSTTSTTEAAIDMTSLTERTTYEVEVALNSGFTSSTVVTFTTLVIPTITSVSVDDITKTTATATVAIANPDGTDRTVHLRYREKDATPADTWTTDMEDSSTGSQEFDLTSLKPGTTYEVEASFDSNFATGVEDTEFTTTYAPSISSVSVDDITKTTAIATVSIANPDDTLRTVHLQYRKHNQVPEAEWTKPTPKDTSAGSETFDLTSLTPGTTYEVQASFDNSFSPHKDTTFTTVFEPSISGVSVGSIEKTTATATVVIANPDGTNKTVNLQYREYNQSPEAEWTKPTPKDTDAGSETFDLTSLIPGTTYEVQASFDTNFDTYKDTTFTTKFAPTISAVRVDPDSITKTTASVIVIIANPDGTDQTVQLQYRIKDPQGNWSSTQTEDTTTGTATINLTGLTAGTTYDVEVSLASGFGSTQTATFTTKYEPSISSVSMGSVTQTTATAAISIDNADGSTQTVHLQYREKDAIPQAAWMSATPETSTTSAASIGISGLTADKTYEVEVWLANDTTKKVTATFTTLEDPNGTPTPSVSSVGVSNITMTTATATVNIANPGTAQNTVNLRYSMKDANVWTDKDKSDTGSTVAIDLSGLIAGTTYEVEAWLSTDASKKVTATFTTSSAPSISSISVGSITKTSASAAVNIANPGTAQNTVNLRYSIDGEDIWTDHTKSETGSTVSFPLSGLTAGATYEVEAWLGSDTDNKATATFTTTLPAVEPPPPPLQRSPVNPTPPVIKSPEVSSVRADNITKTTARAVVDIDHHDGTELTVELRYQVKADVQDWTTGAKTAEATSSASPATKNLESLTPGTEYVLQASFDDTFPDDATQEYTFRTERQPSIQSVSVSNVGRNSARATINIADSDGSTQTAKLQYRTTSPQGQWSTPPLEETSTDATAVIDLDSLTADTDYEVQAWLATDVTNKKTDTFRTSQAQQQRSPVAQKPSISSVTFINIMQTSAVTNVSLKNAGTGQKIVRLHYRADGTTAWSTPPKSSKTKSSGRTISLTGLAAGTTYEVQVWLNSGTPPSGTQIYEFTTLEEVVSDPSISNLEFENIGQTSATAMVKIADAGTDMKEVYLKHSIQGEDNWSMLPTPTTTYRDSASIALDGLQEQTIYEVAVALSGDFNGMTIGTFTTLAGPNLSGVSISGITQTSAVATVNIANAGTAQKTVYLRHRRFGETEWDTAQTKTTTDESAAFDLTGLSPQTKYEVETALSSDFTATMTAAFTTLSPDPGLSGITVKDIRQTIATAKIEIANPGDSPHTVHLRYRTTTPQGEWSSVQTADTVKVTVEKEQSNGETTEIVTGRATINMSGLSADTEYEVQASLDSAFEETLSATFTTLRYPSLSGIDVTDITKTTATAELAIADPDGSSQTVHLRYRTTTPQGDWSGALTTTSTTAEASINLTGLITDTEYEVEVSLTSDFTVAVSDTFRTLPPDPVVSKVSMNSIRQTTATAAIDIANVNGGSQTVSLRYRTITPRGDWSDIQTTMSTTAEASIDLSGLTPGTEYDVQASLDGSFPTVRTKHTTFTTLRYPSIDSVEAENIGRNGATISATIADSHGAVQTVYVRHSRAQYTAWRPTQQTDSVEDVASIRLRGLSSGTEYIAEASLDSSFSPDETKSVTFTTRSRDDDDSSSEVVAQAARAVNVPLLGLSPQMLRFTAIEGGDNPPPQAFLVWNRAQGSMSFNLSNQQEWLSQQPTSGVSNGPDDQVTITASVDSSALASGQYVDVINIEVTSSGKSPGQVIVVLDVLPPDYIRQFVSRDEGGVVVLPDGTVKIAVQPLSPPKDVDIELMKLNLQAYDQPPGEKERVVVAIESNTYPPGGDTPEDVAYSPYVELWVQLPQEDAAACDEGKTRVYSVEAETWSLVEHRCETDESDKVWVVAQVERLGAFALVIDDAPVSPTPTPVAAAVAATPTPTAIPASAPAVAVQRISLPAQPPTPVPTSVPTAVPMPNVKTTIAPTMMPTPTPTAVPAGNEPSAPTMQASAGDGGSGGFGKIILAALGVPMLIGTLIVVYLLRRERLRREAAGL